tara:strand:- start:960 stop:1202 length:243 start_codon:yes stop_codon:yes gene_type:complete
MDRYSLTPCVIDPASFWGGLIVVYFIGIITLPILTPVIKKIIKRVRTIKGVIKVETNSQPQIIIKNFNVQDSVIIEEELK